jgi:hypothetical protein
MRALHMQKPVALMGRTRNGSGRTVSKGHLPRKTCPVCGLPFTWRRKWARDWDAVKYCSQRCRKTGTGNG